MPGIFSSCTISARPGLSSSGPFGKAEVRRKRGFDSCSRSSKYGSGTSRTESSYGSLYDSERTFASIHSEVLRSQRIGVKNKNSSVGTATTTHSTTNSQRFYSNKENNAMIFSNKLVGKDYGREEKQRQYKPSRSSSPCEWGYFVDTNIDR